MTPDDLQEVVEMGRARDEKHQAWLRHLVLLSSAILTALVSLHADKDSAGNSLVALRLTWLLLGLGILSASVALYAGVWIEAQKVKRRVKLQDKFQECRARGELPPPISVPKPKWSVYAEAATYLSLTGALIGLVTFALLRSGP